MSEAEQFYDAEIAPALAAISEKCKQRGMSLVAMVEFEPGEFGTSRLMQPNASLPMLMVSHCAKTAPNIDGYIIGLARYCRENDIDTSGSIVMNQWKGGGE